MCQKIFPKLLLLRCSSQMPLYRLLQKLRLWGLSLNQSWIIWSASASRCDRFPKPLSGHCRPYQKATKAQGWPPSETTGLYVPPEPEVRLFQRGWMLIFPASFGVHQPEKWALGVPWGGGHVPSPLCQGWAYPWLQRVSYTAGVLGGSCVTEW